MSDPLTMAAIVGAGVGPTFTFLYACLQDVLARRRRPETASVPASIEVPAELKAPDADLVADLERTEERVAELQRLKGALSDYAADAALLRSDDADLVSELGRLRLVLSHIYGRDLVLEPSPAGTGAVTRVRTVMVQPRGTHVGLVAGNVFGAVEVDHRVEGGADGAMTIGALIEGDIGVRPAPGQRDHNGDT